MAASTIRRTGAAVGRLLLLLLVGCGGSETTTPPDDPPDDGTPVVPGDWDRETGPATARFRVDVTTGEVTVAPLAGSRAIFSGQAVEFQTSRLLDDAGNVGVRSIEVRLINRCSVAVGELPGGQVAGLRAVLGDPVDRPAATTDLRALTQVATFAGSGGMALDDGPNLSASFYWPTSIAVANDGRVYVTQFGGGLIRCIADGFVSTLAGSTPGFADGTGANARFEGPFGIAANPVDGSLVVADFYNNRVRRVTTDGRVTTIAGTGATGTADGPGHTATLTRPQALAVDDDGIIYLAEYSHRIRRLRPLGGDAALPENWTVDTLAGSAAGYQDGAGGAARFNYPAGICIGPDDALYVADASNRRIRRVGLDGEVTTIAGSGANAELDGPGTSARFAEPYAICSVGGALFVGTKGGHRIRQLRLIAPGAAAASPSSWLVSTVAGTTQGYLDGAGNVARFYSPYGLAATAAGVLLVADYNNHVVRSVTPTAGFLPLGVPDGLEDIDQPKVSNPDGYLTASALGSKSAYYLYPERIAPGGTSSPRRWNFVVPRGADYFEFTVIVEGAMGALTPPPATSGSGSGAPGAQTETLTGQSSAAVGMTIDGPLHTAVLGLVRDITCDAAGNVYFTQEGPSCVRRIGTDGRVTTLTYQQDDPAPSNLDGDGLNAKVYRPLGIWAQPDGQVVWVADTGYHGIRRMRLTGGDPAVAAHWNTITLFGGFGFAEGDQPTARLNDPVDVVGDAGGNVYFVERAGQRVRMLRYLNGDPHDDDSYLVKTIAGDTSSVSPATGYVDGDASGVRFCNPLSLTMSPSGDLFVWDEGNHRIRQLFRYSGSATGWRCGTFAGDGGSGYLDGASISARFSFFGDITCDSAGWLYLADGGNHRIRRISPNGWVETVAGRSITGTFDATGNNATFVYPDGVCVDASGTLYVVAASNTIRAVHRLVDGAP